MDPRLEPLAATLRLNTRLFLNCLDGLDDATGLRRPSAATNHMTFIAAHLVGSRAFFAGGVGGEGTDPFAEQLGPARSIDEVESFPTLAEVRSAWEVVTRSLMEGLAAVGADALAGEPRASFPIDDPTLLGMIAFLTQHDTYHLGQLSILRKHFGFEAMSYA